MNKTLYRIGQVRFDRNRRELRGDGGAVTLSGKRFDVLAYLMDHRDRVVGRAELESALWPRTVPSPSVLARTVMGVRKAFEDLGHVDTVIGSVHGVGYRFVAELIEEHQAGHGPLVALDMPAPRRLTRGWRRVGILPCVIGPDEPGLTWFSMGLISLVARELASDVEITVASAESVIGALAAIQGQAEGEPRARALAHALGLDLVVTTKLSRQAAGYWLEYLLVMPGAVQTGTLLAPEPVALVSRLGHALHHHRQGELATDAQPRFMDPHTAQTYARAIELMRQQSWGLALAMLDVVCLLEPDDLQAALERLRCAAALGHERVELLGQALVAKARERGDIAVEAQALARLAYAPLLVDPSADPTLGERHQKRVSQLIAQQPQTSPPGWVDEVQLALAYRSILAGRPTDVLLQAMPVAQRCRDEGRWVPLARADHYIGLSHMTLGAPAQAVASLESATRLRLQQGLVQDALVSAGVLAAAKAMTGYLDQANDALRDAVAQLDAQSNDWTRSALVQAAAWVCAERLEGQRMEHWRRQVMAKRPLEDGQDGHFAQVYGFAAAVDDMAAGRLERAASVLERAARVCLDVRDWSGARVWLALQLRVASRRADRACVEALEALIHGHALLAQNAQLCAAVARAQASQALQQGRRSEAMRALGRVMDEAPAGREADLSRIDLAWMLLEDGHVQDASRMVRSLGPFGEQHPAGLLVRLRCHAQASQTSDLMQRGHLQLLLDQALKCHGGHVAPAWALALGSVLATGCSEPGLNVLMSESWMVPG